MKRHQEPVKMSPRVADRCARALTLLKRGKRLFEIAKVLGVSRQVVRNTLVRAGVKSERLGERGVRAPLSKRAKEFEAMYPNIDGVERPRCPCGLMLPCHGCLATATTIAERRSGDGATYPEAFA
jgi:DNA-binding CsgD family transcriptional regulator